MAARRKKVPLPGFVTPGFVIPGFVIPGFVAGALLSGGDYIAPLRERRADRDLGARSGNHSDSFPSRMRPATISFAVIIPAAGTGSRSGRDIPKQYVELAGEPVLRHAIRAFAGHPGCAAIVIPIDDRWRAEAEAAAAGFDVTFVPGGEERQHSIANALGGVPEGVELVLVHDAARPCVSGALVERVIEGASRHGAAIPALPVNETVKRVDADGAVIATIPRGELRLAQTPQGFRLPLLREAYAAARRDGVIGTDDASLVEHLGRPVVTVEGDPANIKITLPGDFDRARRTLDERRG